MMRCRCWLKEISGQVSMTTGSFNYLPTSSNLFKRINWIPYWLILVPAFWAHADVFALSVFMKIRAHQEILNVGSWVMDSITALLCTSLLLVHTSNCFHINTYKTTERKRYLKCISFKTSTGIQTKSRLALKPIFISFTCIHPTG